MKVKIFDSNNQLIAKGEYLYLEGGRYKGKISFHIQITDNGKDTEIHFFLESKKELLDFVGRLNKILRGRENE